jgi:hypothetical protein
MPASCFKEQGFGIKCEVPAALNMKITSGTYRVLMMVYITQNYWAYGLSPSSGILKTRKHNIFQFSEFWTMDKVRRPSNSV